MNVLGSVEQHLEHTKLDSAASEAYRENEMPVAGS